MPYEIKVKGLVQNVGYRRWVQQIGEELGIKGVVWNANDGTVRLIVDGIEEAMDVFIEKLRRGPDKARVQCVVAKQVDKEVSQDCIEIIGQVKTPRFIDVLRIQQVRWTKENLPSEVAWLYSNTGNKMVLRELVGGLGGKIAKLIVRTAVPLDEAFKALEDNGSGFIKPRRGYGGHASIGLRRNKNGLWENAATGKAKELDHWREWIVGESARSGLGGKWLVEELLVGRRGGLPDDIKFYCFDGKPKAISVMRRKWHNRLSLNMQWFYPNWQPMVTPIAKGESIDRSIKAPDPDVIEDAEAQMQILASNILLPFIRIDLYDTQDGIMAGEITRTPSSAYSLSPTAKEDWVSEWNLAAVNLTSKIRNGEKDESIKLHKEIAKRCKEL